MYSKEDLMQKTYESMDYFYGVFWQCKSGKHFHCTQNNSLM